MDLKAKYLSETCSDSIEFLRQLRQTTEPIGGSTIYDEDGELVEYDIAIEAVRKVNKASIEKACSWLKENYEDYIIVDIDNKYEGIDGLFLEDFRKYMGE